MSEIQRRETAYRLFAAEFDDATLSHQEADEERAPNYVVTPTGARVNRLFAVGVLTEVESVNENVLRGRVVDPTGAFVVYAGQYQPDEMATLERLDAPTFVAVTGKARTFSPDDADRVYTSVRPESISEVDAATRDRWVVDAAESTLERVATFAAAARLDERGDDLRVALTARGVPPGLADGIPRAMDHYGTTPAYLDRLRETAVDAVRVVAGDRDEASAMSVAPDAAGDGTTTWSDLADEDRAAFGSPLAEAEATAVAETDDEAATGSADGDEDAVEASDASAATSADEADAGAPADEGEESPATEATTDADAAAETTTGTPPEATAEADAGDTADTVAAGDEEAADDGESAGSEGGIGDFEPGDLGGDVAATAAADEAADDDATTAADEAADEAEATGDAGMYEMDEDERAEIEDEYGTEFASGNDVADPGEADIETPDAETVAEPADDGETGAETESSDGTADGEGDAEPTEVVELDDYLLDVMAELDDGDGADRAELVERVASDLDVSEAAVEDAIQDALIGGQCYEPGDDRLKAI